MAELLGLSHTGYHRYESEAAQGSKQRYLPMQLARRIAAILQDHAVNPDDVLALAGIGVDEATTPDLSAGEEQLLDDFRELDAEQRQLVQQLARSMRRAATAPIAGGKADATTVHSPDHGYRGTGEQCA